MGTVSDIAANIRPEPAVFVGSGLFPYIRKVLGVWWCTNNKCKEL